MAQLAFLFCSFVWGTSFILLERVTHALGPVEIGIWRMLCGSAVVGFCWWTQRGRYRLSRRDLANIVFSSVLFSAPPNVIQAYVLSQGYGHGFFGTMVAAIPLLTILVSMPMLGVVPTWRELVGVLGGLFCIFMLVEDGVSRGMSVGLLALTLVIPLSSAMSNTFIKWRLAHVPAAPLTTIVLLTAAFTMMPLEFFQGTLHSMRIAAPEGASVTMSAVIYLVLLGMVGSGVSTMAFNWMVLEKGPLFAGMTTYVVPVLALLWGTVDGETIRPVQMVAIAGALGMVALVQSGRPETDESDAPAIVPISSFQAAEVEAKVA